MADLATANEMVQLYINAEKSCLEGQSVSIAGKSYSMANISEIRAGRKEWEKLALRASTGRSGPRVSRIIPMDC